MPVNLIVKLNILKCSDVDPDPDPVGFAFIWVRGSMGIKLREKAKFKEQIIFSFVENFIFQV